MSSRMLKTRVHLSDSTDPVWNLAVEEYLMTHTEPDEVVLYLWQNDDTIVIGRNQNLRAEVKEKEFRETGGMIVRRLSGGGAVYHDLGNLNFTFAVRRRNYGVDRQLDVVLNAVRRAGVDAKKTGRNDVTADGLKFSGNAFYRSGDFCYHHGTLLVSSNLERMTRFLVPSQEKLKSKGVASVRSRVVNLTELAPDLTVETLSEYFIESFAEIYGSEPVHYAFPEDAAEEIAVLAERFASSEWILGREIQENYLKKNRFKWGEAEIRIETDGEDVLDCVIYSDAMDQELICKAQQALIGTEFDDCAMSESILSVRVDNDKVIMRDDLAKMFS